MNGIVRQCATCFFWSGPISQMCQRHPPGVVMSATRSSWPKCLATDKCGLWAGSDPGIYIGNQVGPQGAPGSSGHSDVALGDAVLTFGSGPASDATVTVTGQGAIAAGSHVQAWIPDDASANMALRLTTTVIPGVGFTVRADSIGPLATGTLPIKWSWV